MTASQGTDGTDPLIGVLLHGRYRVLERVAAGAMGVIYKGVRVGLDKPVAIKFLHATMAGNAEFQRRFGVEARAMSRLQHRNCVSVIDFGVHEVPYLVMDFVRGTELRTLILQGPVAVPRAFQIIR